jgi:hypothetical protein
MEPKMINLHKALKIKNRLAGEFTRLKALAIRENSKEQSKFNANMVKKIHIDMNIVLEKLIDIKKKICCANVGIYYSIELMKELKGMISFYQSLDTTEGDSEKYVRGCTEAKVITAQAYMNQEAVDIKTVELQKELNVIQDTIDAFNAKTVIQWEDDSI